MAVVNPFWAARFIGAAASGARWGRQMAMNRSFAITANRWRDWAKSGAKRLIGGGAGLAGAGVVYKASSDGRKRQKLDMARYRPYRRVRRRRGSLPLRLGASRRRNVINDPASYKQLAAFYKKSGRRISPGLYNRKVLSNLVEKVRFRWANCGVVSRSNGGIFLYHKPVDATNEKFELPIHLYNLTAINQEGVTTDAAAGTGTNLNPPVGYKLRLNDPAVGISSMEWQALVGFAQNGTTTRAGMVITAPGDTSTARIGREGFLSWTRVRLCLWGKVKVPTQVRVSIVKFKEAEFTPDLYVNLANGNPNTVISEDALELFKTKVKPLVTGLIASNPRPSERSIKVLKSWTVNINPIDAAAETAAASDPRGHMKHLDIFNRWNRRIDYTQKKSGDNDFSYANLVNAAHTTAASNSYAGYPRELEKSIYLMIESVTPDTVAFDASEATASQVQVSYDINVESSFGHIQKLQ